MAAARAVDGEVRQVAGVRAGRVVEPVLRAERVVVAAGRRERRADALADRMEVDAVPPGVSPSTWTLRWSWPDASSVSRAQPIV